MASLSVQVVYALPGREDAVSLKLPAGATALDALHASGLLERHPDIDLARQKIGIYGKVVSRQAALRDGDRVEVYRPLLVEAKEARRRRALRKG
jgi:putative ubiquitin-RnfH superfamily antitoxin RatB of RatAB toxin-antitoxin module